MVCMILGPECMIGALGVDYVGLMSTTADGDACLPWTNYDYEPLNYPNGDAEAEESYCRYNIDC